jgi:hypothetical protein
LQPVRHSTESRAVFLNQRWRDRVRPSVQPRAG